MPIYEYECQTCRQIIEHLQGPKEPDPSTCSCGGPLKRLISRPAAFHFKGKGFYTTDHGKTGRGWKS